MKSPTTFKKERIFEPKIDQIFLQTEIRGKLTMEDFCDIHRGDVTLNERVQQKMRDLPQNQGKESRHKCTFCAYDAGYLDGLQQAVEVLQRRIEKIELNPLSTRGT